MQFRDLQEQYRQLKGPIDQAIGQVMADGNFIGGGQVVELEENLAQYVGKKECVSCGNGTDALQMALQTWKIGKGDAVFVPDFTFFASGEVVSVQGATPVFVDVNKDTYNMDSESLEKAIQKIVKEGNLVPRVVIVVDLFGLPADFWEIRKVSDKYNLKVLEDGAQGFGGLLGKQRACGFGDISTTSFFPAKPLGCYGDGGAVFTDNKEEADFLRSIRVHGKGTSKYNNVRLGCNSRLDTIQAAILQVKLQAFQEYELEAVNHAAECYTRLLKNVVVTPTIPENYQSSWAQYVIRLENKKQRDRVQRELKEQEIPTMIYYSKPMHEMKAFQESGFEMASCPNTVEICDAVLALPVHPYLKKDTIELICDSIKQILQREK